MVLTLQRTSDLIIENRPRRGHSNDPNRCKKCRTRKRSARDLFCKRCGLIYDKKPSFPMWDNQCSN